MQAVMYGPLVLAGRFDPVSKEQSFIGMGPKGRSEEGARDYSGLFASHCMGRSRPASTAYVSRRWAARNHFR